MSGYNTILRIRHLEQEVDALGFRLGQSKHGNHQREHGDIVGLFPKGDALPIFSRDAEVFVGTLEELEVWIRGVQWSRKYDSLLRLSDDNKRAKKEQQIRNEQLMRKLRDVTIKTNIEA